MKNHTALPSKTAPAAPRVPAPLWADIRGRLEAERERISTAIRDYPPPIPACDVQFNRLLEERQDIARELKRLEALHPGRGGAGPDESGADGKSTAIAAFLAACPFIDDDTRRAWLKES